MHHLPLIADKQTLKSYKTCTNLSNEQQATPTHYVSKQ